MRMNNLNDNPFADQSVISLSELKARIEEMRTVDLQRRRDISSALTNIAKWLNLPETMIPAAMSFIRPAMAKLHPITLNVSPRRIQNVRSLLMQAFRLAGLSTKLAPYQAKMNQDWSVLWGLIAGDRYARTELSRLFRYCSNQRIAPTDLNDRISAEYLSALEAETLVKNPKRRHQSVCRVWNQCAARYKKEGWPQISLDVPRYDARLYVVRRDLVSDGIKSDLEAFSVHLSGADPFSSIPKPFRPISVKMFDGHLWRYLSALHHTGLDLTQIASFDDLVTRPMFERAMRWFWERNGNATSKHIGEIAWAVRVYAIKYRQADEATVAFYGSSMARLRVKHDGLSPKNQKAMGQFSDITSIRLFVNLPQKLWNLGAAIRPNVEQGRKRKEALILIQAAVAVEILMFAPVRLKNLTSIRLDTHMSWRDGRLHLNFPLDEVKNSVPLDFTLPAETSARVQRYIKDWRSLFLPNTNPFLFPGREGKSKDQSLLGKQIKKAVFDHSGLTLTPHQFRHTAAKLLLDAKPGHYEVVRKVLGHKNLTTTYAHYAGAETEAAVELYDDVILSLRGPEARAAAPMHKASGNRRLTATPKLERRASGVPPFMDPLHLLGSKRGR